MVNLRSRSKARVVTPRAAPKAQPTASTSTVVDDSNLSEAALRKLPRAELQKLAMAHKVKANMKSELIIQQLSSLRMPKKKRPAEEDPEEGPSRKRLNRGAASEEGPMSSTPESHIALLATQCSQDTPIQSSPPDHQPPEAGPSASRSASPGPRAPVVLSYNQDLFSGTESEMTEEEQLSFDTPVSSRLGTPPPANVKDLNRCVTIMQEISTKDAALLNEVTGVREIAAKLRKRAREVRDLVKAEIGRRERMEAYFRYWQEIEPMWHRRWLYGEKMVPDYKIQLEELDEPAGPPTIPSRPFTQGARNLGGCARPVTPDPARKPTLSPEQLRQKRDAIISRQEVEQHQLEALWRREVRGENSSRGLSPVNPETCIHREDVDAPELGEGSSLGHPPSADQNTAKEPRVISSESSVGLTADPEPSP